MKVALGSDHAGWELKEAIRTYLNQQGYEIVDMGPEKETSVDYPDFALPVAEAVASGKCHRGILICSTGIGMSIAANKVPGIRAALCHNIFTTWRSRQHNDANILVLGGSLVSKDLAQQMVKIWMETEFEGNRHARRLKKINQIEKKYCRK